MDFKDLPHKVQIAILMMHSIGILETMCEAQNKTQEEFQHVLVTSFASVGIEADYMTELLGSLTDAEESQMRDYFASHEMDLDEADETPDQPKAH